MQLILNIISCFFNLILFSYYDKTLPKLNLAEQINWRIKLNRANETGLWNLTEQANLRQAKHTINSNWAYLAQWLKCTFDKQILKKPLMVILWIHCFDYMLCKLSVLCIFVRPFNVDRRLETYKKYTGVPG